MIADVFARTGLEIPLLSQRSYKRLAAFFNIIGGSYRNPLDISSTFLMADNGASSLNSMLDVLGSDPGIDCIALELFPVIRPLSKDAETADPILDAISDFKKRAKPFIIIVTTANSDALATEMRDKLVQRGIPSFSSFERAAKTVKKLAEFYQSRKALSQN